MTPSAGGAIFLSIVGATFIAAALRGWLRRDLAGHEHTRRRLGITVDLMVGVVAIGDAACGTLRDPERAVMWAIGTAVLVGATALLVVRHHRGGGDVSSEHT